MIYRFAKFSCFVIILATQIMWLHMFSPGPAFSASVTASDKATFVGA